MTHPDMVVSAASISLTLPPLPTNLIPRDNCLATLASMFSGGLEIVIVEGPREIGKTTIATSLVHESPDSTISLFIKPASKWAYDFEFLRKQAYEQLHWIIYNASMPPDTVVDDGLWRTQLYGAQRIAKQTPLLFVLDGIDSIPATDRQIAADIVGMLPLGRQGFRFVFTRRTGWSLPSLVEKAESKTFQVTPFSSAEAMTYLEDMHLPAGDAEELVKATMRRPGLLASIRRSVAAGLEPAHILRSLSGEDSAFALEWSSSVGDDRSTRCALALCTIEAAPRNLVAMARILGIEEMKLRSLLSPLPFLSVDAAEKTVEFVTAGFREYAETLLSEEVEDVRSALIQDLIDRPEEAYSSDQLPKVLEEAGRTDDLLRCVGPKMILDTLGECKSLFPLKLTISRAVSATLSEGRDQELLRLSASSSVVSQLAGSSVLTEEVLAHLSIGNPTTALRVAESAPLEEDRLELLAIVASWLEGKTHKCSEELLESVELLVCKVAANLEAKRAKRIARNLVNILPHSALKLIDASTRRGGRDADHAYAELCLTVIYGKGRSRGDSMESVSSLHERIESDRVRGLVDALRRSSTSLNADGVVEAARGIEDARARLLLLGSWIDNAVRDGRGSECAKAVRFALVSIVTDTKYIPNAREIRQICAPLPFLEDKSDVKAVIGFIDGQKAVLDRQGPSIEVVRLQLLLVEAVAQCSDTSVAIDRAIDCYVFVQNLPEIADRIQALSELLKAIATLSSSSMEEAQEEDPGWIALECECRESLVQEIDECLTKCAEQDLILLGFVEAMASTQPIWVGSVIKRINTFTRRDTALVRAINGVAKEKTACSESIEYASNWVGMITVVAARDSAVIGVLERLDNFATDGQGIGLKRVTWFKHALDIEDPGDRSRGLALLYRSNMFAEAADSQRARCLEKMKSSWALIEREWDKVGIAYEIAIQIGSLNKEVAMEFLEGAEKMRDSVPLSHWVSAMTYLATINLAISAFSGLVQDEAPVPEDLDELKRLIDRVPSPADRTVLLADIAERLLLAKGKSEGIEIGRELIRRQWESLHDASVRERKMVWAVIAPVLHASNHSLFESDCKSHDWWDTDAGIWRVADFLLSGSPTNEPLFRSREIERFVAFDDLELGMSILAHATGDALVYSFCSRAAEVVTQHKGRYNPSQKRRLVEHISRLASEKMPQPGSILHDGYGIAMEVARFKILSEKGLAAWSHLVDRASDIENEADKVFVLRKICGAMPGKLGDLRSETLNKAILAARNLPSAFDEADRLLLLAQEAKKWDRNKGRELLVLAADSVLDSSGDSTQHIETRIVDYAHRLDPELAQQIAERFDSDPARSLARRRKLFQDRVQRHQDRQELDSQSALTRLSDFDLTRVCTDYRARLTAGVQSPLTLETTRVLMARAAKMSFMRAAPVLELCIQNLRSKSKYRKDKRSRSDLRRAFSGAISAADVAFAVAGRAGLGSAKLNWMDADAEKPVGGTSLITSGSTPKEAIERWMRQFVSRELIVCDAYFGPKQVWLIREAFNADPEVRIKILAHYEFNLREATTSRDPLLDFENNLSSLFDGSPPRTEIVLVLTGDSGFPIHDRWILSGKHGIRLGSSVSASEGKRITEVSRLTPVEVAERARETLGLLNKERREIDGKRISYRSISI